MNNSLGQILYHSSRFFSVSIRRETRASRWRLSDLKPAISSLGLKFVSDFCWKRSDVGFGRSLSGGFASMAFSGGNGGSGKSDSYSGEGGDDEDDHGSNLVGSWLVSVLLLRFPFFPTYRNVFGRGYFEACCTTYSWEVVQKHSHLVCFSTGNRNWRTIFTDLGIAIYFALLCTIFGSNIIDCFAFILIIGILDAALCTFVLGYSVKQVMMLSAENASKPPDNVECCICLSTYEGRPTWSSLPCNHWFHSSCINCWVQINPICPICRLGAYGTT